MNADLTPDPAEDTRLLEAIRDVLIAFDWENGDHKVALYEIERIMFPRQS